MAGPLILLTLILLLGSYRGQPALIMLSSLLIVSTITLNLWSRVSRNGLRYTRSFEPSRIFPGERSEYVVEIVNQKRLPLPWVRIEEQLPSVVVPVNERSDRALAGVRNDDAWQRRRTVSLGWNERVVLRQRFTCSKRGDYVVGPATLETGDPLGMFPVSERIAAGHVLLVYPPYAKLGDIAVSSRFPFGPKNARPPAVEDPSQFAGVRDYRPGDPRRWVDWKASARRLSLQTRIFTPTTLNTLVVALDVQTMPHTWQGYDAERLEASIAVAATLVRDGLAARQPVGLASNSCGTDMEDFQVFLRPGRSPSQLEDALALLARLGPLPTMAFGTFLHHVIATSPFGTGLIAVCSMLTQETADDLGLMAHRGHQVALVFLGEKVEVTLDQRVDLVLLPNVDLEEPEPAQLGEVGADLELEVVHG